MDAPLLIPMPRRMRLLGGTREFPERLGVHAVDQAFTAHAAQVLGGLAREGKQADVLFRLETGAPSRPGAYQLRIEETSSIRIFARDQAGLRHALATLKQLWKQYAPRLPLAIIEDAPAFTHRGVMLDVSRDRVPKMEHLLSTVELLAELKFNHLQLYTEHTFAYRRHEEVWAEASPMTPEECRVLDEHCRRFGITLAANQNCFGHLASWLKRRAYQHLAEIQGNDTLWKFYHFDRAGPFSLCPIEPKAATFVDGLLEQLLPCFSSGLCNINCDETFDVGQGRSREACAARGAAAVYFDFLDKVVASVRARGARPMFWADIALSHPEAIDRIPDDMICLAWDYEPTARFGAWCQTLRGGVNRPVWVCPGTSSWRSLTGRSFERRGNIEAAAREGLAGGAEGFMVCDWGDVGHRQQWPVSLHGIVNAAEAAWSGSGGPEGDERSLRLAAESFHVYGDRTRSVGQLLEDLGDIDVNLRRIGGRLDDQGKPTVLRNATLFFHDYHLKWSDGFKPGSPADWDQARSRAEDIAAKLSCLSTSLSPLLADELDHTLRVARTMIDRAILRRRLANPEGPETTKLAEAIARNLESHRRLWRIRSRTGGLEQSSSHDRIALAELNAPA